MKKIDFAMIEVGGGHKAPASAVIESLNILYPHRFNIRMLDFMKELGCIELDTKHKKTWDFLLKHPHLAALGYHIEDFFWGLTQTIIKNYIKPFYPCVYAYIKKEKPDIIFSTHFLNSWAVAEVKREHNLTVKLVTFVSEIFDVHAFWIIENSDYFIVSSTAAKHKLIERGIDEKKIYIISYPLKNSFLKINHDNCKKILSQYSLDKNKKTLVISFGGQGIGDCDKFIDALIKEQIPLNIIVITAKNKDLYTKLIKKYPHKKQTVSVSVFGFVTNMNELFAVSDFCFIKSGPATTMEAMLLEKPIIFYKPAAGNEKGNITYCMERGIALYAGKSTRRFIKSIKILFSEKKLQEIKANYKKLHLHNGSDQIARFIAKLAEDSDLDKN